jgi:Domain of unknown function (DUF4338)
MRAIRSKPSQHDASGRLSNRRAQQGVVARIGSRSAGQIELPPVSYVRHNPLANRARPEPVRIDTTPIQDCLRNLQALELEPVRRTGKEPLWNSLLEEHHYLGYEQPVGEHLKYLV